MNYKVLTLWEPWATLLVNGIKKIETRPKPTNWTIEKGSYLIHSAKKWSKEQADICLSEPFKYNLQELGIINYQLDPDLIPAINFNKLHFGYIIGVIDVVKCNLIIDTPSGCICTVDENYLDVPKLNKIEDPELSFGNYSHGRYAWMCDNERILKNPIQYKGGQGYYVNFKEDINKLEFI